jgi:tRNA threonylcarbamoyladenosine biosynthesis protein TsaB
MSSDPYTLAIETSARIGSVSLGCGPDILETADLPQQRRHAIDLIPAIDRLCETAGATSDQIDRIYISLGPGSFTGLRVGITTAKTIAYATGCELYGIDSLQVVAANAPADGPDHLAVCLNAKRIRPTPASTNDKVASGSPKAHPL